MLIVTICSRKYIMSNIQARFGASADDAERDLQTQRTAYADNVTNVHMKYVI
jgi:hypothetical protein